MMNIQSNSEPNRSCCMKPIVHRQIILIGLLIVFTLRASNSMSYENERLFESNETQEPQVNYILSSLRKDQPNMAMKENLRTIPEDMEITSESQMPQTKNNSSAKDLLLSQRYNSWNLFAADFMPSVLSTDRYITLIWYVLGFPGNLISFFAWINKRMYRGNSAAIYLAALSLNDFVVLAFALSRDLTRNWGVEKIMFPGACQLEYTLSSAHQYTSGNLVLGFTIERWLAICYPFSVDRICSPRRAVYLCLGILIFTVACTLGNAVFITNNYAEASCNLDQSVGFAYYVTALEVIFSALVPSLVLIFNCLVIREMARIHQSSRHIAEMAGQFSTPSTFNSFHSPSSCETNEKSVSSRILMKQTETSNRVVANFCYYFRRKPRSQVLKQEVRREVEINALLPVSEKDNSSHQSTSQFRATVQTMKCGLESGNSINSQPMKKHSFDFHHTTYAKNELLQGDQKSRRAVTTISAKRTLFKQNHSSISPVEKRDQLDQSFRATTIMLLLVSFFLVVTALMAGIGSLLNSIQNVPALDQTEEQVRFES
ncbi:unnamed protein product [Protopolystoma xenopodis]|uniref:G-protein coupled receptors family 1 profile domain-containing protein n=1 Tax=Protopolystoma xenopodis TaxID=117903 RepID=A0A3S5B0P9_9PLAT|nr:unnamed protein product [Protopolystoma xenopodis]